MTISPDDLHETLRLLFPINAGRYQLILGEYRDTTAPSIEESEGGHLRATIMFVRGEFDAQNAYQIRDIVQQSIFFIPAEHRAHPHALTHYPNAWAHVVRQVFQDDIKSPSDQNTSILDMTMPHEFVHHNVLNLKRAQTFNDFVRAFSFKSRLGKFLASPST